MHYNRGLYGYHCTARRMFVDYMSVDINIRDGGCGSGGIDPIRPSATLPNIGLPNLDNPQI